MQKSLIIGANGQIGCELVDALIKRDGSANVIAADIAPQSAFKAPHYLQLNVLDKSRLADVIEQHQISVVYQLAAMLSVTGEQAPLTAWTLNMNGLLNCLEIARELKQKGTNLQLFWPSSIAAFGPNSPRENTPQLPVMNPTTMYGISKLAGEHLCEYYFNKYHVDVRSLRYPGIVSYKSPPGGGTTDYAIAIFYAARRGQIYDCYLDADQALPMIYMDDAIGATLALMQAPSEQITVRTSYNLAGISFTPAQIAAQIKQRVPDFAIRYSPDERQKIAQTWTNSVDDSAAQQDWQWRLKITLPQLVDTMLNNIIA